jgi:hypothetical protein
MTDEMMSLRTLLEKSSDAELLREMVGFAAQRLMELEVESLTGAAVPSSSAAPINIQPRTADSLLEEAGFEPSVPLADWGGAERARTGDFRNHVVSTRDRRLPGAASSR